MRWDSVSPQTRQRWVDWLAGLFCGIAMTVWWLRGT